MRENRAHAIYRNPCWAGLLAALVVPALVVPALFVPALVGPAAAQQGAFRPKLDAAVSALDRYPRFRGLSAEHRELIAEFMGASPDYFDAIGAPLVQGRLLELRDRGDDSHHVVVNQRLARHYFGAKDPIGQRLSFDDGKTWSDVVGVVGDIRQAACFREADHFRGGE